jgi:response regulator NasT
LVVAPCRACPPRRHALRIVIVAPDSLLADPADSDSSSEAERSRFLRIALLECGYNIVAVLPADVFLPDRLAQIGPDRVIVDAESQARDTVERVVLHPMTPGGPSSFSPRQHAIPWRD